MKLTQEMLNEYIGGHLEIINTKDNYVRRGKIVKPTVNAREISVDLEWSLSLDQEKGWVADEMRHYNSPIAPASYIPHRTDGTKRLVMTGPGHEFLSFHHPKGESVKTMEEQVKNECIRLIRSASYSREKCE